MACEYVIKKRVLASKFLRNLGFNNAQTQKILDKKRLFQHGICIKKGEFLESGVAYLLQFVAQDLGIKPLFKSDDTCVIAQKFIESKSLQDSNKKTFNPAFCVFNKPSNLLTHPKNLSANASLLDSIRQHFGAAANACHRLDKETSGLVLCSIDKKSEVFLKDLFSARCVHKEYLAILHGNLSKAKVIESSIFFSAQKQGNLCIKGACENLKVQNIDSNKVIESNSIDSNKAITLVIPLQKITNLSNFIESTNIFNNIFDSKETINFTNIPQNITLEYEKFKNMILEKIKSYNEKTYTFVKLIPLTGRTHQLRIHTSAINHAILGDTLYGVKPQIASFFLDIESEKTRKVMEYKTLDSKKLLQNRLDSKDLLKILSKKYSITLSNILFQNSQYFIESSFNFTSIFTQFIYFQRTFSFLNDTKSKKELINLARLYYATTPRLMLHSNRLKFLHHDFIDYRI